MNVHTVHAGVHTHTHTHAGCIYPALQQRPSVSQLDHMGDSQQAAGLSPDHLHCRFGLQQHGLFHSVLITNICGRTDNKHLFVCSVNFLHFVQYTVQLDHTMYWTVVNPYNNICNYMWRCLSRLKVEELFSQRCFSSHPRGFLDESSLTELFNLYVKMMEIVVDRLQGREVTAGWGNLMGCMLFLLLFSGQFLSKNICRQQTPGLSSSAAVFQLFQFLLHNSTNLLWGSSIYPFLQCFLSYSSDRFPQ